MDIKEIIKWSLQRWWWFVISIVLCGTVGTLYYTYTAPKYKVRALLMLRQEDQSNQDDVLRLMGYGKKSTSDEVQVLSSRDLIGKVVDSLDICSSYFVKDKGIWKEQYPSHTLDVVMLQPQSLPTNIKVLVKRKGYKVSVKQKYTTKTYRVATLDQPISTFIGDIMVTLPNSITEGKYSVSVKPRILAVDYFVGNISIGRLSRESNIIQIQMETKCPVKSVAVINAMLDIYNEEATSDKNLMAIQAEQFLSSRLDVVKDDLNRSETELEAYKRENQIADLSQSASSYQSIVESYKEQMVEIDCQFQILDAAQSVVQEYTQSYAYIAGNMGLTDQDLCGAIDEYNALVKQRDRLLQTATPQNMAVKQLTMQLDQRIEHIRISFNQLRLTMQKKRQFVIDQRDRYNTRLASVPETERQYLIMNRDKDTKEKQYLYLLEKREENAMALASEVMSAKVVERAQLNPNRLSPKLSAVALLSLIMGLCLPLMLYFFGFVRKEYL